MRRFSREGGEASIHSARKERGDDLEKDELKGRWVVGRTAIEGR